MRPKITVGDWWIDKFPLHTPQRTPIKIVRIGTVLTSRTTLRPFKTIIEVETAAGEHSTTDIGILRTYYKPQGKLGA